MKFDVKELRNILGHYPTGVCVITGMNPDHAPVGMVVGSFTSVSLDPPLVGFFPTGIREVGRKFSQAGASVSIFLLMTSDGCAAALLPSSTRSLKTSATSCRRQGCRCSTASSRASTAQSMLYTKPVITS